MVGHQAISPDPSVRASRRRGDQAAVKAVILGPEEHRRTAIAALSDVMRQTRHNYAGDPRHALAPIRPFQIIGWRPLSCKLSP
jgi:hypothetical protein